MTSRAEPRTPRIIWVLLIAVLLAGAWLRFVRLEERGLVFFDEGSYVMAGRFLRGWCVAWLRHGWAAGQHYLVDASRWMGLPAYYAKPAHDWVVTIAMLCGNPKFVWALRTMALMSMLSIIGTYWIGRRCFDAWTGLTAAALLAVSCYHLAYARSALAEAGTMWWFLLAVAWLVPPPTERPAAHWRLLWSGACGAVTFLSNYRLWMVVPLLWLVEGLRWRHARSGAPRALWVRLALITAAAAFALLLWMGVDWWCMRHAAPPAETYAQQLIERYGKHLTDGFTLAGWWTYPYLLALFDGWPLTIAGLLGTAGLLWRGGWAGRAVGGIILIVLGFFSMFHTHHARYIAVLLPWLALATAWLLVGLVRWIVTRRQTVALSLLVAGVMVWRWPAAVAMTRWTTGYHRVLTTLERLAPGDPQPVITTQPYVLLVYGGRWYVPPPLPKQFEAYLARGVRYFVTDFQLAFGGFEEEATQLAQELAAHLQPVAVIQNPAGASPHVEAEHIAYPSLLRRRLADQPLRAAMGEIRIYDLRQLRRSAPAVTTEETPQG